MKKLQSSQISPLWCYKTLPGSTFSQHIPINKNLMLSANNQTCSVQRSPFILFYFSTKCKPKESSKFLTESEKSPTKSLRSGKPKTNESIPESKNSYKGFKPTKPRYNCAETKRRLDVIRQIDID